ncbi:energy transducer TonB [Shewanella submarina]|uniref:Energy transducer TonB n=1 Tax=Shewanella submarina TaxID=2016376 RepID=A0ABV7GFM7_9GAMM|nr:energy transducer TonB [Shewanella submarina]MCL1039448.1 energy transducer TonB [Shewanella submarina]
MKITKIKSVPLLMILLATWVLNGCSTTEPQINANEINSRLWIPAAGPLDFGQLFASDNVSFTVSYRIEESGEIANIELTNIEPATQMDKTALARLEQTRFIATQENPQRIPVSITNRIEIRTAMAPVLMSSKPH